MDRRLVLVSVIALLGVSTIYLVALWQPERQLRLHQANLLRAVEKRNWERFAGLVADDYSDRWEHDKEIVLRESREVFRQFLFLNLEHDVIGVDAAGGKGTVAARIVLEGSGGPLAEFAKQRVNSLTQPFTFQWQQQSWKPWDWQLTRIDHSQLELPEM